MNLNVAGLLQFGTGFSTLHQLQWLVLLCFRRDFQISVFGRVILGDHVNTDHLFGVGNRRMLYRARART